MLFLLPLLLPLLLASCASPDGASRLQLSSERADARGYDGVYQGHVMIQELTRNTITKEPARLTVMPEGNLVILNYTLPSGKMMSAPVRGTLVGNTFRGRTKGRWQVGAYRYANHVTVRFSGNSAVYQSTPVKPPPGYVDQPELSRCSFRKIK